MADLSGLLGVISGGLRGYSTGAGLDLAAKLREQAALDQLAMQKFREQEDIRRETDRIGFERKQQVVDEARRESLVEQLTGVLSQAGGVGLDVDKVYAGGLDAFSNDDLTASIAGIGGAVSAKQQQAADIASRQKMEFEGLQEARRQAESGSLIESRGASAEASRALAEERRRPDEQKSSADIYKQSQMIDDVSNQFNKEYQAQIRILQDKYAYDTDGVPDSELEAAREKAWEATKEYFSRLGIDLPDKEGEEVKITGAGTRAMGLDGETSDKLRAIWDEL
jgi:hypothetical protein